MANLCTSLGLPFLLPIPATRLASPGAAWASACVFFVPFMAAPTVGSCKPRSDANGRTQSKPLAKNVSRFCVHDFGVGHSLPRSGLDGVRFHAGLFHKFAKKVFAPLNGNADSVAAVLHVFLVGHPSAIFRGVASVVVDAVKFAPLRPFSHVFGKGPKVRIPSFANLYASLAVVSKRLRVGVVAPLAHIRPCLVEVMFGFMVSHKDSYCDDTANRHTIEKESQL